MVNLNRAHAFQNLSLVVVRMMTKNQAVRNLKCVSLFLRFLVNEISRRRYEFLLRNLRIVHQEMIHVGGDPTHRDVHHVKRNHLDEQRLRIALVMYASILVFLASEFCLAENSKVVHCHFRTEPRKLPDKSRYIFDQRTGQTLKILLIDKVFETFGITRSAE